jgi:hypothetical protein
VEHLARHAQGFRRDSYGHAGGRQDVFLDDLTRMDGRQSLRSASNAFSSDQPKAIRQFPVILTEPRLEVVDLAGLKKVAGN